MKELKINRDNGKFYKCICCNRQFYLGHCNFAFKTKNKLCQQCSFIICRNKKHKK